MAKRSRQHNGTLTADNPATVQNEAFETTRVLVLSRNVWNENVKWLQYDVIEVEHSVAELMVKKGLGKVTKDDVTAVKDADGQREVL
tara:strand:- start:121 stop:381 length:261 start_codon:yes stop_codon:yes gene_type:complete